MNMRVAMYYNNNDIRIEALPKPEINDNEILVKVISCGICGSDVMEWYRVKKAPCVLGHEITGVIEKVGENVKNIMSEKECLYHTMYHVIHANIVLKENIRYALHCILLIFILAVSLNT